MHLTLSPQQGLPRQPEMTIHVANDVITIDGTAHDLSAVPEDGEGWPEEGSPFLAPITRTGGVVHVMLVARLGDDVAPQQDGPWIIEKASGAIIIPAQRKESVDETDN